MNVSVAERDTRPATRSDTTVQLVLRSCCSREAHRVDAIEQVAGEHCVIPPWAWMIALNREGKCTALARCTCNGAYTNLNLSYAIG